MDETPALCVDHNRGTSEQLGLRLEPRHERIARTTVDVYPRETETPCEALEDRRGNLHMELHRGRVGMHLQDGHLASGAIEIHLIHEDVGFVGLDEGDQLVDSRLDLLELPIEDERRIEDDDGIGHQSELYARTAGSPAPAQAAGLVPFVESFSRRERFGSRSLQG